MEQPFSPTITVRPSRDLRPGLLKLAQDLDKSEGQILLESAAAILEMIESGEDRVPQLVRAVRVLRANNATFSEPAVLIGSKLRRDKREVSLYSEIRAGHPSAVSAEAPPEKIRLPASLAKQADFAVKVRGDSMEPMVSDGDIAVFRATPTAGNGQFVAAVIDGQMLLKRFTSQSKGRARLESLNPAYAPIPWSEDARIQGVFEGKFSPEKKPSPSPTHSMMNEAELHDQVGAVIQKALTEMKCMVLRAQHLSDDINALRANPTTEMVAAFCQKHGRLQAA